ncbi:MAG: UDP-N-acetylglucosamine--N-acetylmuramyl-(pentapeptide) pyrophosphoryl-undecaprenol N-acetylglucosamine transferase [Candidatus Omnitrophica bacterium]|nr:UDP-N-acetylglucosamine--N-acetylmuramyl-(pentapeptide) pyrophosphoryl-undecaprenol N-acetylglucosamine transferase [Candidatus Omnitrophota bacterium]MDD5770975.1 UDP-N-acetylglucosamine--N-acetylmuramyl-(pentapeptide) pyrophosphoryl-undecaprenol N-acetylglucosamine transferase [Candidatus Omnitrophota bacterium]
MKVILVTGSSGGHIFPAMALMQRLKDSGADVLMVLPKKDNGVKVEIAPGEIRYIRAAEMDLRSVSGSIKGVYYFLLGAWDSFRIAAGFKPDTVIGFGSLNTIALLFWAWLFRAHTLIHEQNVVPGRANRLLARFVDKIAVSFTGTGEYLKASPRKIALTGNPLRKEMVRIGRQEALDFFGFKEGKFNILVTGGSQGSHKLNIACSGALSACGRKEGLQVVHISGQADFKQVSQVYSSCGIAHKVFEFLTGMQYAYSAADLVICRAGATTIAELERFSLPALLVPYPFAYAHQSANARVLADCGCVLVIGDEELCLEKIGEVLTGILNDRGRLNVMRQAYSRIRVPDACGLLTKEVLGLNR